MSSLEKKAWLGLWSMCPAYCVYFAIQIWFPDMLPSMLERISCLAVVAGFHAVAYVTGLLIIRRQERGEGLLEDERDRAINARATRIAYFFLMGGIILVGMIMPFGSPPWEIVNTALLVTVLAETIQLVLVLVGYRRNRLAY